VARRPDQTRRRAVRALAEAQNAAARLRALDWEKAGLTDGALTLVAISAENLVSAIAPLLLTTDERARRARLYRSAEAGEPERGRVSDHA
jgi:hypothetical protein